MRVLQYHDRQQMSEIANLLVKQNPTSGEGYGVRAALDLMLRKYEDADKDGLHALESNGTAYFIVERNSLMSATPFSVVVLGISKSKIEYLPAPGFGSPETIGIYIFNFPTAICCGCPEGETTIHWGQKSQIYSSQTIDVHSIQKVKFEKGKGVGSWIKLSEARPFIKLEFKGSDGKTKSYKFADFGTMCPTNTGRPPASDLISVPGDVVCGITSPNGTVAAAQGIPLLAPQTWRE